MPVLLPAWLTSAADAIRRLADRPWTLFCLLLALNAIAMMPPRAMRAAAGILALGGRSGISAKRMTELEHILALNLNVVAVIDSEKDSEAALRSWLNLLEAQCQFRESTETAR